MKYGLRPTGHPPCTLRRRDGAKRIVRHALPVVLILAAAPPAATAQSLVCHPIRRGESATQAARRVTGDGRNAYQTSFQIMNDASRFIPKSQYNRIRAGWRACVITPPASDASPTAQRLTAIEAPAALHVSEAFEVSRTGPDPAPRRTVNAVGDAMEGLQAAASEALQSIGRVDLTLVWLGAAMVVPWFGFWMVEDRLARRRAMAIVLRHVALRFVEEFDRPLVRSRAAEPAVRSRLRIGVRRGRFDILLAPATGRRYPNLTDHRQNVEYDVARVMQRLAGDCVVRGTLSTHAEWVVVPLQLTSDVSHRRAFAAPARQGQGQGVACISSL